MDSLYVDFDGLDQDVEQLRSWEADFDDLNTRINSKLEELNSVWQGKDYLAMKNTITSELGRISGPDGMIQSFVSDSIKDLELKKEGYTAIQNNNANYWG